MSGKIRNMDDMCRMIDDIGFLPFFANHIDGFSVEERVVSGLWYGFGDFWPAWEWKGPAVQKTRCAYGKFFRNKAGFISREWYFDFANYRRDGYDFDARYDDGLAKYSDKEVYNILEKNGSLLSGELKRAAGYSGKNGKKGFDGIITRLQMQGYIITENFEYRTDKNGGRCGWGIARYTTPELFFGSAFEDSVYERKPEESFERMVSHLSEKLDAPKEDIVKLIR